MSSLALTNKPYSTHHLRVLLDGLVKCEGTAFAEGQVNGLSLDSRQVKQGNLFLACNGTRSADETRAVVHGIAYAGQAIHAGARFIAWEPTDELDDMPVSCELSETVSIPLIRVEKLHEKSGLIAARYYQHPSEALTLVGVTGTNGKTSTTDFIAQLLCEADHAELKNQKCALIGTLGNGIYPQLNASMHTTPDALSVQKLLAEFRDQDVSTVVMEVSSHALAQDRVSNVQFNVAVFTNLSRDHLDYHGDMQHYAHEKLKLFQFPSLEKIIINVDDKFSTEILSFLSHSGRHLNDSIVRVSQQDPEADLFARNIKLTAQGIAFELIYQQQKYSLKAHLVGRFNIDNLLAAIAVVLVLGYDIDNIVPAIEKLLTVPGRMELIAHDNPQLLVVVDYAHTPDALEKALISLRAHCVNNQDINDQADTQWSDSSLMCVFGCGGDRDRGKRPLMAAVAERYADHIIVTSDNPRTEKDSAIIDDIVSGFSQTTDYDVVLDRAQAIEQAILNSQAGDIILIAGKGHEEYQEINSIKHPFSDKEVVQKIFSNMGKT